MAKIVILGGGFAAIAAAEEISKAENQDVEVTVISSSREFVFFPALVPYIFGAIDRSELRFDLASKLAEKGIRFIQAEVLSIDAVRHTVALTGKDVEGFVHFDHLLIALGRRLATERVSGYFEHADHILGIDAAQRFKAAVERFDTGEIVVGLCPGSFLPIPVCESAVALAERFKNDIADGRTSVTAIFPETLDDAFFGSALFRDIRGTLDHYQVQLIERFQIARLEANDIRSLDGRSVRFDLAMLLPPFQGQSPILNPDAVSGNAGFIHVNEMMQVTGQPHVYAAGDIASIPGPRFGYHAIRQGRTAAANILAEAVGRPASTIYEHEIAWAINEKYTDPAYFHYGFWDESLKDFNNDIFFGMARSIREKYGSIKGFGKPIEENAVSNY